MAWWYRNKKIDFNITIPSIKLYYTWIRNKCNYHRVCTCTVHGNARKGQEGIELTTLGSCDRISTTNCNISFITFMPFAIQNYIRKIPYKIKFHIKSYEMATFLFPRTHSSEVIGFQTNQIRVKYLTYNGVYLILLFITIIITFNWLLLGTLNHIC